MSKCFQSFFCPMKTGKSNKLYKIKIGNCLYIKIPLKRKFNISKRLTNLGKEIL